MMIHLLPELPFAVDALEPAISSTTIQTHHGKHHQGYLDKLNALLEAPKNRDFVGLSLTELVKSARGPVFNNAAQAWNHEFYWESLTPRKLAPRGELLRAIDRTFQGVEAFQKEFAKAAEGVFGSGWAWLVSGPGGSLTIETTSNADNPVRFGKHPLLCIDVWEHAYYLDYRQDRTRYLQRVNTILNWEFAERNYGAVLSEKEAA